MNEELKTYRCDPDKNDMCDKKYCYRSCSNNEPLFKHACCRHTFYKEYKMNTLKRIKELIKYSFKRKNKGGVK